MKRKAYEKPVIQDLGHILTGSAQVPMGLCSSGDFPSGAINECSGGNQVATDCVGGGLWHLPESVCQAGGGAADYCGYGAGVTG